MSKKQKAKLKVYYDEPVKKVSNILMQYLKMLVNFLIGINIFMFSITSFQNRTDFTILILASLIIFNVLYNGKANE